jgi:hypothetical protein
MVLGIKSLDTTRKKQDRRKHTRKKGRIRKETEELQDLYCTGETKNFTVKETKKEFKPRVNICKVKDGSIICDQKEVLAQWNDT